jgi:hypothetical protein
MRTLRIALVSLLSLLLVAGCTTAESGQPAPGGEPAATSSTGPTTATETATTETAPPSEGRKRPKDIDLTKVDICKTVVRLPRPTFGLTTNRPPLGGESDVFPGNKGCFAPGDHTNLSLLVAAVANQDTRDYINGVNAEVAEFDAQGYPLYVLTPANPTVCFGVLDVHDGQFVWISYGMGDPTGKPVTPQAKLCQTVPKIAASMVTALG